MNESLGRYRLIRLLGEGGMGRTYLADVAGPRGFSKRVVLKVVRDERNRDLDAALFDEARVLSTLSHRNICAVLDFEEVGEQALVILDYVDGLDLRQLLGRRPRLPWTLAAFIGSEVAAALDYAHRRTDGAGKPLGLVHRDVSPANILLSWEGEAKLADFGVAHFTQRARGGYDVAGKLGYMAPEQQRGEAIDGRADVFALAATLAEAICGDNPLARRSAANGGRLARLPERLAPSELAALIARAADPDRDVRPTAGELREALLHLPDLPKDPSGELARFMSAVRSERPRPRDALARVAAGTQRALTFVLTHGKPATRRLALIAVICMFALAAAGYVFLIRLRHMDDAAPSVAALPVVPLPGPSAEPEPPPPVVPTPAPPPPPVQTPRKRASGTLSVNATPWANVFLDDRKLGNTPQLGLRVTVGRHALKLVSQSGQVRKRVVEISAGRETRIAVNFADP